MKRKEMVKYIHGIISKELHTTEEFNLKDCSSLLKKLETLGMLPPEAEFKRTTGGGCLCTMRESCSSCGGFCNEWEPE